MKYFCPVRVLLCAIWLFSALLPVQAVDPPTVPLTDAEFDAMDLAIARAMDWIVANGQRDGSIATLPDGQPGITSLCVLAMLAGGELPDEGPRGEKLAAAIDYVLGTQKPNGLLALVGPRGEIVPQAVSQQIGRSAVYNHAISGLMLAEAYAMTSEDQSQEIKQGVEQAIKFSLKLQNRPKDRPEDLGGWRYLNMVDDKDADLSIIAWQLMFLRSAKNAGFDVPTESIDAAVGCVERHFNEQLQDFEYAIGDGYSSRAMTGAGILALAHAGRHESPAAKQAAKKLLKHSFLEYNGSPDGLDRYHYSLFHCTQAAHQLGGNTWEKFFPPIARVLIKNQKPDGAWDAEISRHGDGRYGRAYTTALAPLVLQSQNELLPVFQR